MALITLPRAVDKRSSGRGGVLGCGLAAQCGMRPSGGYATVRGALREASSRGARQLEGRECLQEGICNFAASFRRVAMTEALTPRLELPGDPAGRPYALPREVR